jgi:crotonobetainyl-CoA:carnitine CoA-transferase CaiB-like acyl-CoA transferase
MSKTSCGISRRAPLIGEHNQEIYEGELGFSKEEMLSLKQAGII